jgi:Tol biopolymer transport system component
VQLVSKSSSGVQGDAASTEPTLSGDGSVVAFTTNATNLTAIVINTSNSNVVRRVLTSSTTGTTTLVSGTGVGGNFDSLRPSISEDGTRVAFWSYASNLVTGDGNGIWDIFVYDTTAGISRVSLANGGGERSSTGEGISSVVSPTISGNGRYVAYSSWSTNVVSGDTGGFKDVFVVDTQTSGASLSVVRASVTTAGVQADAGSPIGQLDRLALSYDGNWVAFNTNATNLGTTAGNVVMHNISTGATRAVSTGTALTSYVGISRTGAYASFLTGAQGLDTRFNSSGVMARFTGVGRAWWWID